MNSESPRKSQKVAESLRRFQRVSESPRKSQKVSESLRKSQKVSESLRESQRVSESLRKSQRVSVILRESQRVSESIKIVTKCSKTERPELKIAENGDLDLRIPILRSKWAREHPKRPKSSKYNYVIWGRRWCNIILCYIMQALASWCLAAGAGWAGGVARSA